MKCEKLLYYWDEVETLLYWDLQKVRLECDSKPKQICHSYYIRSWCNKTQTINNSQTGVIVVSNDGGTTSWYRRLSPQVHLLYKCSCCSYPSKSPRACSSENNKYRDYPVLYFPIVLLLWQSLSSCWSKNAEV